MPLDAGQAIEEAVAILHPLVCVLEMLRGGAPDESDGARVVDPALPAGADGDIGASTLEKLWAGEYEVKAPDACALELSPYALVKVEVP